MIGSLRTHDDGINHRLEVERFILHPNITLQNNNIGLIKTKNNIRTDLQKDINCVQLPTRDEQLPRKVRISGWGATSRPDPTTLVSDFLSWTELDILTTNDCRRVLPFISNEHICIGDAAQLAPNADPKDATGSCRFDSGTPAVFYKDGKYVLIGILTENNCDAIYRPEAYINVPLYLEWIVKAMNEN